MASIVVQAGHPAFHYTNSTVRVVEQADLAVHDKPVELAQANTTTEGNHFSPMVNLRFFEFRLPRSLRIGVVIMAFFLVASVCPNTTAMAQTTTTSTTTTSASPAADEQEEENFVLGFAKRIGSNIYGWIKAVGAGAWAALITLQSAVRTFTDLAPYLKTKFSLAGMHGAWRPSHLAGSFYESTIPFPVRNLGNDAVLAFIKGKHASHIEAVVNNPGRLLDNTNIVWERAGDNLARGGSNMTASELMIANTRNALHATGIVATNALHTAAVAGFIGMSLEGVVSVSENLIYVYRGERDIQEAGREIAQDVLEEGVIAAIGGATMGVIAALGGGSAIAAAAPVLIPIGGVVYLVTAYQRIKTAWDSAQEQPDDPAQEHSPSAENTAASSVGKRAFGRAVVGKSTEAGMFDYLECAPIAAAVSAGNRPGRIC